MAEHISTVLNRALRRPRLAPLSPNAFLSWVWNEGPRTRGTAPLTYEDVWFERGRREPELTREEVRRQYVRLAALVRRNQRLGNDPWEGIL
jgi:hypothetical protein